MPHDPANRLAVHAAALQQPGAPIHSHPELAAQARASPVPDVNNWAADFARFSNANMRSAPTAAPAPAMQMNQPPMQMNFQSAFGQAFGGPMYGPGATGFMGPQAPVGADFDKEMAQWVSNHGGGNMSEVDAAMEQMARELELNEAALPVQAETTSTKEAQSEESSSRYTDLEAPEIGNLSLQEREMDQLPTTETEQAIHDDAAAKGKSAVSEAAERLLESVQHENGEKWQNSVFLSLMRDFRDGRKDIVDNEIRAMEGEEQPPQPEEQLQQQPTT